MDKLYTVAVVGATGAVGQKMIETLEKRKFPIGKLKLLASKRSVGKKIMFGGTEHEVEEATPESFEGIDFALFSAGGSVSLELVPEAVKRGAIAIDNTSAFRMDEHVPLVVPEVNPEALIGHNGIIANPNCSTIQMMVALKPIYDHYGIKRIVVSTYQAVSGAGDKAISELKKQTSDVLMGSGAMVQTFPHQIAFNLIPQIDSFLENGFTKEEMKMVNETRKILCDNSIEVTPTCVRVPVVFGHSESILVETKKSFELDDVRKLLRTSKGLKVIDNPGKGEYPMPLQAEGTYDTYVGRIRRDLFMPNGLNMWVVSDNVLKGAALNAVQIAELLIR